MINKRLVGLCFLIGIVCVVFIVNACKIKQRIQRLSNLESLESYRTDLNIESALSCSDPMAYVPDEYFFEKQIRINIHFMCSEDSLIGFSPKKGPEYMWTLLKNANKRLLENKKMNLPEGNETPALNPKYQYLKTAIADERGYFWHYDDDLYGFVNKGKYRNNYSREVIEKYEIGGDSIVNIFVMPHHRDSLKSKSYKTHGTGIALGNSLKIAGLVEDKKKPWAYATLLNHEVGHVFGLRHSWHGNDGCDDTPVHPNCWAESKSRPGCEGPISNNMMDYNNSQMAISPCQLGIVHKSLTRIKGRYRKFVREDWCQLDDTRSIIISDNVDWYGERDVRHNIIIENGATLTVHCRLSMPPASEIRIKPGGQLIVNDNGWIHSDCDDYWNGIIIEQEGSSKGQLQISHDAQIEDIVS